ncbi:SH3 and multiple ankyrin repeat domains protein 1 [Liparis tanakae]|uniref:SH3 and multiple ankyrin repeat domains protein 1 n=1 Tax=Liparis tanakae TaxID=230148 RepID=A0A4Z2GCL8_9TELE|nr:SH3 and multiple ankyrin repeat domains protein 1 [Liparis tanakae]
MGTEARRPGGPEARRPVRVNGAGALLSVEQRPREAARRGGRGSDVVLLEVSVISRMDVHFFLRAIPSRPRGRGLWVVGRGSWDESIACGAVSYPLHPIVALTVLTSTLFLDYIIKEKTVLLQKKDNEGFGFVLRGAKAQTPIEEFTPTPAFPALQYLESVDEGGVAWRAGLRMGDFLIEVNGRDVVKVGHRQVVNMIRQGSNSLMVKVVMVARNPELEDTARKRAPQQTKRLTPPAIALRSKSMTSELEDMGELSGYQSKACPG